MEEERNYKLKSPMKLDNKYKSASYWTQLIQLELFENVRNYLDENNIIRKEFANKLGVSRGYVSQILNGDFNHKLSKLTELALACELVPKIEFVPSKFAAQVARQTYLQPSDWKKYNCFTCSLEPIRKIDYPLMNKTEGVKRITYDTYSNYSDMEQWHTAVYNKNDG